MTRTPDTYTTQWTAPTATCGEWVTLVARTNYAEAKGALDAKVKERRHCRIIVHSEGREDYTIDERGPFNGPARTTDR